MSIKFKEYKFLIYSDLYRLTEYVNVRTLVSYIFSGGTFKYIFLMRTCQYTECHLALRCLHPFVKMCFNRLTYKLGIDIPPETKIGSGLYIGHFGGIIVNERSIIGKNCNISHGVTLGKANRGRNKGYPVLGDNIYIGPGAKIIGAVTIGNNVAIGANCVVTKDIPDNSVVVGIPGKVISQKGSKGYVNRTDYENKFC